MRSREAIRSFSGECLLSDERSVIGALSCPDTSQTFIAGLSDELAASLFNMLHLCRRAVLLQAECTLVAMDAALASISMKPDTPTGCATR
jgi:hypothetical protein